MDAKTAHPISPLGATSDLSHPQESQGLRDVAADLFLDIGHYSPDELRSERVLVRKKLDRLILPLICVTYALQFLDKTSLNYASAYSLIPALGLEGQRYSWVAAVFNFGYLSWAIPSNLLIQRFPVAKYTGLMILLWSIVLCCHVAAKNYAGILVLRFLLGMLEAGISPAIVNIVSMFYPRAEQPLRMCLFLACNGFATMIGALLGYGLGHVTHGPLASWQLIFLVIGLMNFVWSWVFLIVMPDAPTSARFLSHKQRIVAIDRIAGNMTGVKSTRFRPAQALEAGRDPKVWCLTLIGLALGVINGGVSNFGSSLIKGFGFSGLDATLLQLPSGAVEFVVVTACGLAATYLRNARCLIFTLVSLAPLGALLGIRLTGLAHPWALVGCTWLGGIVGAPIILSWNLLATNVAGHTKRALANGLWFTFYAAGNIAGANIFFARQAPRYFSAITGLMVSYGGAIALAGALAGHMAWENRRRDRARGVGEEGAGEARGADAQAVLEGFQDRTDMESQGFRYAL